MTLPGVIRSLGSSPDAVFAEAAVDPGVYGNPENRIPVQDLGRVLAGAARITARPDLALLLGDGFRPEKLGLVGEVVARGPDVSSALNNLVRLFQCNSLAGYVVVSACASSVLMKFELRDADFPGAEFITEGATGIIARLMQSLCGTDWRPDEVHLSRPKPPNALVFERYFDAPIRFSSTEDAILFSTRWLGEPVRYEQQRRDDNELEIAAAPYSERVRRQVAMCLGFEPLRAQGIAHRLGISRRQLFRQLKAEGTSYQALLDEFRFARARHLLVAGEAPLAQIAYALGFPEQSAFSRAFSRWTGMAPNRWRKARAMRP